MSPAVIQPYGGDYLCISFEHACVADAMHPGILACPADAPLRIVAWMMATRRVHCVAVIGIAEGQGEPPVWGIVSDLDVVRSAVRSGFERTAGELALTPVVSVEASLPLREAGELMIAHSVRHLVVVAPGSARPIGVLSSLDVAATIAWGGQ
jgi:CBS domain-containing protein